MPESKLTHATADNLATEPALFARQTLALFADAVRRLRAARLFWLSLGLCLLVAGLFGLVGINDGGLVFPIYGQLDAAFLNTQFIPKDVFYKLLFVVMGVKIWLAWAAVILALISTADLVPSLVADGSADLYLSRPLGRVRLFLTRYLTALLFVAAQATAFAMASFAVIGLRGGVWLPGVFWAIPTVVLFFSFLYCVSALVGLVTGNAVAAILATLLVWFASWSADIGDQNVLEEVMQRQVEVDALAFNLRANQNLQARLSRARDVARQTAAGNGDALQARLDDRQDELDQWRRAHEIVMAIKAPLPKTGETIALLDRRLIAAADLEDLSAGFEAERIEGARRRASGEGEDPDDAEDRARSRMVGSRLAKEAYDARPLWWSLGTSGLLQAILLGVCCWRFARRDL